MSYNYNKIILVGNVGSTPELRQTKNGTFVTNFSISTIDRWKNKEGEIQKHKKWHRIVCWGKVAETVSKGIKQGMLVLIEGSISYRTYISKENIKTHITEIKATEVKKWANAVSYEIGDNKTDNVVSFSNKSVEAT
jgi:single-strand DNA-binding protein